MTSFQAFALFILPIVIMMAAVFAAWMFTKFNKKPSTVEGKEPTHSLYGYDLDEWNYLGMSMLTISPDEKSTPNNGYVFFFVDKEDESIRSYHIPDSTFHSHPWVHAMAKVWKAGEKPLYAPINRDPSKYLEDYMKEKYSATWNKETGWWKTVEKQDPETYWGA